MKLALIRALLAAALSLWLTTSAWAGVDEGLAAANRGDYATALEEWLPVAEQGDADAQNNLGAMYDNARGVAQDYVQAIKWYRLAAEQGHAVAQNNLGFMYVNGLGVPQDYAEAMIWYRLAAEQGDTIAQNNLGLIYGNGYGVLQDYVQAYMWFNLAAANGDEEGHKNRDIAAEQMTPAQITEAQRLAREWLEEHGE